MIVVAGFNTAIDKRIELDALRLGDVQRARSVHATPGGKGLHVAKTIAVLGESVQLVGLIDRAQRGWFNAELDQCGVEFHGVEVAAMRTCITLREANGRCTEVLESGAPLDGATRDALFGTFRALARKSRMVVLSGSLPKGCGDDSYASIVREMQATGIRCLVDTSGEALPLVLAAAPFVLKPNRAEAGALFGRPIETLADAQQAIGAMAATGVTFPLLSLGEDGTLLSSADEVLYANVDIERAINPVGSGDCLLGGVAVGLMRGESPEAALRLGVASGAANAASIETGCAPRADIEALLPRIRVSHLPQAMREALPTRTRVLKASLSTVSIRDSQA